MRQITEPLTPHSHLILAQTTSDEPQTSNVTNHTLNYIYYIQTTKQKACSKMSNLATMLVLNWHNQNPIINTVRMLKCVNTKTV